MEEFRRTYDRIAAEIVDPFMEAVHVQDVFFRSRLLVVMRGLPGSGKTTLAEAIVAYAEEKHLRSEIFSANHLFMVNGEFVFDANNLGLAHDICYNHCEKELRRPRNEGLDIIIVDNTNLRTNDFELYADLPENPDWLAVVAFACPPDEQAAQPLLNRAHAMGHMIHIYKWLTWLRIWRENQFDDRNRWLIRLEDFLGPP